MPLGGVIRCIGPPIFGCPETQKNSQTATSKKLFFPSEECIQDLGFARLVQVFFSSVSLFGHVYQLALHWKKLNCYLITCGLYLFILHMYF